MNSMSPEQRRQLESMMNAMLQDDRMRLDLARLAANLEQLYPMRNPMGQRYPFQGDESLGLGEAMDLMSAVAGDGQAGKRPARMSSTATRAWARLTPKRCANCWVRKLRLRLEQLARTGASAGRAGYVEKKGNRYELTPRGMRKIGQKALKDIFSPTQKG